jgi:hypothetical protein
MFKKTKNFGKECKWDEWCKKREKSEDSDEDEMR